MIDVLPKMQVVFPRRCTLAVKKKKTSCLCVFGVFGIFGISKVFGSNLVRTTLISLNLELDFKSGSAKIRTLNRTFGPVPKSSVRTLVQNRTMTSLREF